MLTPTFSVSAIGLVGALAALLLRRQPARSAFGRGLLGAWVGFLLGGVLGVVIYVVTLNGAFVVYLGHLGALLGTIWLLRSREPIRPMRGILPFGIRR
jgi:ribose/xylose/arabinose/galactoside ABC-type transport system permease subunit